VDGDLPAPKSWHILVRVRRKWRGAHRADGSCPPKARRMPLLAEVGQKGRFQKPPGSEFISPLATGILKNQSPRKKDCSNAFVW
jgi:hypothetical protein